MSDDAPETDASRTSPPESPPEGDGTSEVAAARRPGWLRRLYDWVLHWAHTPYGAPALAVISFCESSFFPIPPDPLLIAMGIARPRRAVAYAVLCTVASVLGGLLGYLIGALLYDTVGVQILKFYGKTETFEDLTVRFAEAGFFAVLIAALTPIPYKVFTIAAGVASLPLPIFVGASILGRGLRFVAEGWLIGRYGEPIQGFIDRWFPWLAWLFIVLGIAGFVLAKGLLGESH